MYIMLVLQGRYCPCKINPSDAADQMSPLQFIYTPPPHTPTIRPRSAAAAFVRYVIHTCNAAAAAVGCILSPHPVGHMHAVTPNSVSILNSSPHVIVTHNSMYDSIRTGEDTGGFQNASHQQGHLSGAPLEPHQWGARSLKAPAAAQQCLGRVLLCGLAAGLVASARRQRPVRQSTCLQDRA